MQRIINKILYLSYLVFAWVGAKYVGMVVKPPQNNTNKKRIISILYPSKTHNGALERMGEWKNYINKEDVEFDVYWSFEEPLYKDYCLSKNPIRRYIFFYKVTWDRIKLARRLKHYDAVWIQRAYIPVFPFKRALFEKQLRKHGNVIYDFFDANYTSNFQLVVDTMTYAQKVTVANEFLAEFGKKYNPNTYYIPYAFIYNEYPIKQYGDLDRVTIGWMGAPGNFNYVKEIAPQLIQLEKDMGNIDFLFLCRSKEDIGLKRLTYHSWGDEGFDYFKALQKIDIGINPMNDSSDKTKGKVSYKCLEYMGLGIGFATSPFGIPKGIKDGVNARVIDEHDMWYESLKSFINDKETIVEYGREARKLMENEFDYSKNVDFLIDTLLNK